jgi:hypothetical protein
MSLPKMNHVKNFFAVGTGIFVFLIYLPTVIPDLTWFANSGDGGELITAAVTLGIPHPPGYPTYVLLGKLVSYLPFEPIAYRFHLFSAFCTAVSAAFVTATAQRFISQPTSKRQLLLASVPALLFAFSPLVWQQAIVAEVYALNLAVVAAFLWALLSKRPTLIVGFLLGLSLTTHLTSLLLLPLAIASTPWAKSWKLAIGFLLGVSPFLILPILAQQGSPVIWGNPTTVGGWWWLVSAKIYHPNQLGLPLSSLWLRVTDWANILTLSFLGWPLLLYSGWQLRNDRFSEKTRWWSLVGTAVLYLSYAFFYNTQDAFVLTLPAWILLSLCVIPALEKLGSVSFLLPGLALLLYFSSYNGAKIYNIRLAAAQILDQTPPNAILLTRGDPDIFALWYFHYVEGQRLDIILVDTQLFAFDWYRHNLKQLYPNLRLLEEDNLSLFQTENEIYRPFCRIHFQPDIVPSTTIDCSKGVTE